MSVFVACRVFAEVAEMPAEVRALCKCLKSLEMPMLPRLPTLFYAHAGE